MNGWAMRRGRGTVAAALAALLAVTACVGSVSPRDLDDEMRARGANGMGERLISEAVAAVREDQGVREIEIRSLDLAPARVTLEARVPGTGYVDAYTYGTSGLHGRQGLSRPEPLEVREGQEPLERQVFAPGEAGLERFDEMIDRALAEGLPAGGYVERAAVQRAGDSNDPVTGITVTDDRTTATVTFGPDAEVIEVEPS